MTDYTIQESIDECRTVYESEVALIEGESSISEHSLRQSLYALEAAVTEHTGNETPNEGEDKASDSDMAALDDIVGDIEILINEIETALQYVNAMLVNMSADDIQEDYAREAFPEADDLPHVLRANIDWEGVVQDLASEWTVVEILNESFYCI